MSDTANTGSSLTGVYATEGTINNAPPANSQVVVFYETPNIPLDKKAVKTSTKYTIKYIEPKAIVSVASANQIVPSAITQGRNLMNHIAPWASQTSVPSTEELNFLTKPTQGTLADLFITDVDLMSVNGNVPKIGDSKISASSFTYGSFTGTEGGIFNKVNEFIATELEIPAITTVAHSFFNSLMESDNRLNFLIGNMRHYLWTTARVFNVVNTLPGEGLVLMLFPTGRPVLK